MSVVAVRSARNQRSRCQSQPRCAGNGGILTPETAPWAVDEARTTTAELRDLAERLHDIDDEAVTACLARAEDTLTEALRADGAVSVNTRLTPAERQAAEPRLADRITAVASAVGVNG